jgi:hypothetical protein
MNIFIVIEIYKYKKQVKIPPHSGPSDYFEQEVL